MGASSPASKGEAAPRGWAGNRTTLALAHGMDMERFVEKTSVPDRTYVLLNPTSPQDSNCAAT